MVLASGILLLIHAAWNLFVWPPFLLRRILRDPRSRTDQGEATRFQRGQVTLLVLAFLLGLVSLIFGLIVVLNPVLIAAG